MMTPLQQCCSFRWCSTSRVRTCCSSTTPTLASMRRMRRAIRRSGFPPGRSVAWACSPRRGATTRTPPRTSAPGATVFGLAAMDCWIKQFAKPSFQEDDPARSADKATVNACLSYHGALAVSSYLRTRLAGRQRELERMVAAWRDYAVMLQNLGRLAEAEQATLRAIEADESAPDLHLMLAYQRFFQERQADALLLQAVQRPERRRLPRACRTGRQRTAPRREAVSDTAPRSRACRFPCRPWCWSRP